MAGFDFSTVVGALEHVDIGKVASIIADVRTIVEIVERILPDVERVIGALKD